MSETKNKTNRPALSGAELARPAQSKPVTKYHYRGGTERGVGGSYVWHNGYSEGEGGIVLYPWLTLKECQSEARKRGAVAEFYRDGKKVS